MLSDFLLTLNSFFDNSFFFFYSDYERLIIVGLLDLLISLNSAESFSSTPDWSFAGKWPSNKSYHITLTEAASQVVAMQNAMIGNIRHSFCFV